TIPIDQIGVGIFYNNRRTRRLTGTFSSHEDFNININKSICSICN
ncbi:unnamed protein product, partial [Rotaria sordida]